MSRTYLHIFINLISNNDDKYTGLQKQINENKNHEFKTLNFSEKSVSIFYNVEYTNKRFFREFFYISVFKELEEKIINEINQCSTNQSIIIYTKDEGVWSEFLRHLIIKYKLHNIVFVNVQHGFLMKEKAFPLKIFLIKFINLIYLKVFGFPKFGIGPFKGPFNFYLLFQSELSKSVSPSSKVISCANLLNRSFIDSFEVEDIEIQDNKSILIALPYYTRFGFYSMNFEESLGSLIPLISSVKNDFGYKIYLRKHPGMKKDIFIKVLKKIDLFNSVIIDNESVVTSIRRSPYIFSFNSTILFESGLVNRLPVVIDNKSFNLNGFPIKYTILDTEQNIYEQLKNIFKIKPIKNNLHDEINWPNFIESKNTLK